ncbi:MAG: DUF120 domain-containing protein, partial [Nitrososphaera sp.]
RSYGWAKCYNAIINDKVNGALLIIERTHHGEAVIEVIAPMKIKDVVRIRDGDKVNIKVPLSIKSN